MLTMSTQETAVYSAPGANVRVRVRFEDGGGSLQDLTSFLGRDWLLSVNVSDDIDGEFKQCKVTLRARIDRVSLSPLSTDSRANESNTLLAEWRQLLVDACSLPSGGPEPVSGDWHTIFQGYSHAVVHDGDVIRIDAADDAHDLADAEHFLMRENEYGSTPGVAIETVMQQIIDDSYGQAWEANKAYSLRDRVHKVASNGYWYWASVAGTSAGAEPIWPVIIGNTVVDNTVTWTCMGTIIQLYTPIASGFLISPKYKQKREPCWNALVALSRLMGWRLHVKWDSGTSAYRLTFDAPDRALASGVLFTWYPDVLDASGNAAPSFLDMPALEERQYEVRNLIEGQYSERATLDSSGAPTRKSVTVRDDTSIVAYGVRPMALSVGSTSQIDTAAEMTTMLNNILADVKDPRLSVEVDVPLFWPVELGDYYTLKACRRFTADQSLAVAAYQHTFVADRAPTTRLTLRGKPAAGHRRWLALDMRTNARSPTATVGPDAPTAVTLTKTQGGMTVTWQPAQTGEVATEYEVHVSTAAAFTPSSSTFAGRTTATRKELQNLAPGTTYYVQVVPRKQDATGSAGSGVTGTASAEATLDAGYTTPLAMQPQVTTSIAPRNPDFEAWSNGTSYPPDRWTFSGTWGVDATAETTRVQTGSYAIKLNSGSAAYIRSELLPVVPDGDYYVEAWIEDDNAPGPPTSYVAIEWCLSDGTVSSTTYFYHPINPPPVKYIRIGGVASCPSGIRLARVKSGATTGGTFYIDSCRVDRIVPQNPPRASYYRSTNQSIAATTLTIVDFDTSVYDSHSAVTTGAGWNFAVPGATYDAKYGAGVYLINTVVTMDTAGTGRATIWLYVNGALTRLLDDRALNATNPMPMQGSTMVKLADGDTMDIRVYQTFGGGAVNALAGASNTWIQIMRLVHDP